MPRITPPAAPGGSGTSSAVGIPAPDFSTAYSDGWLLGWQVEWDGGALTLPHELLGAQDLDVEIQVREGVIASIADHEGIPATVIDIWHAADGTWDNQWGNSGNANGSTVAAGHYTVVAYFPEPDTRPYVVPVLPDGMLFAPPAASRTSSAVARFAPDADFDYFGDPIRAYVVLWDGGVVTLPHPEMGAATFLRMKIVEPGAILTADDYDNLSDTLVDVTFSGGTWDDDGNGETVPAGTYTLLMIQAVGEDRVLPDLPDGMLFAPPAPSAASAQVGRYTSGNSGNGFVATASATTLAPFAHASDDELLDLTDPTQPTVLAAGVYAVCATVDWDSTPTVVSPVNVRLGTAGVQDYALLQPDSPVGASVTAIQPMAAGDLVRVAVVNAESTDQTYYLKATVTKIS